MKINVQSEPQEGSQWYQNDTAAWKYSVHNPESPTYQMEGTVVRINSNDFFSENISFINDWGVERQNGPQSLAMMTKGDRITFHNCKFRSYQDTWMTPGNTGYRHYVKGCYIEGAVDYVYGAGDCLSKIAHYTMSEADRSSLLQSMKKELNGDMFSITVPSMGMKLRTTAKTN